MSMALAALKNRLMLRSGKLVRWRSAKGRQLRLAAAAPSVPWTDLTYALVPNGSTLDYVADAPYVGRLGVMKESYVNALYLVGCETPTSFCTTTDPRWNLGMTRALLNQGEPYTDPALDDMLEEIHRVLVPGGRICLADLTVEGELPPEVANDQSAWAG